MIIIKYLFNNLYFQISMFIIRAAAFIIKIPCSTTTIFISLNVDSKSQLKINGWTYILFTTVRACYQIYKIATITWQITFNEISLTYYCTFKLTTCNQKVLTNVTFVTAIVRLLLKLGVGYKECATVSFRFL